MFVIVPVPASEKLQMGTPPISAFPETVMATVVELLSAPEALAETAMPPAHVATKVPAMAVSDWLVICHWKLVQLEADGRVNASVCVPHVPTIDPVDEPP